MRRRHLGALYQYTSTTTGGTTTSRLTRARSPDDHGNWWFARGQHSGSEPTVGMQPDGRILASLGCLDEVPVTENSIIQIEDEQWRVETINRRDQNRRELQLDCLDVTGQRFTLHET
jgi:hypothetical protein